MYLKHCLGIGHKLLHYSDSCPGQNKNWKISVLWLYLDLSSIWTLLWLLCHTASFWTWLCNWEIFKESQSTCSWSRCMASETVPQCNWGKPFHVTVMKLEDFFTVHKLTGLVFGRGGGGFKGMIIFFFSSACSFRLNWKREASVHQIQVQWRVYGS